jgi:hypothetical protein
MSDLVLGLGLVLVIEGLLWALAPHMAESFIEAIRELPLGRRRQIGWGCIAAGAFLVWLVRG